MDMKNKTLGIVLVILGILMIAFDLLAVPLNIASPGFGWKQMSLMTVGVVVLAAGLMLSLSKKKTK
jgi:hypothetical protein